MHTDTNRGWHRADIVAAVKKRGSNLAKLAEAHGLVRQSMYWALIKPHPRANMAIADFLGVPAHELWPNWFLPNSTTPSSPENHSAPAHKESRTKKKAA